MPFEADAKAEATVAGILGVHGLRIDNEHDSFEAFPTYYVEIEGKCFQINLNEVPRNKCPFGVPREEW